VLNRTGGIPNVYPLYTRGWTLACLDEKSIVQAEAAGVRYW